MVGVFPATRARTSLAHASASWRRARSFRASATMEVSGVRSSTMGDKTAKLGLGSRLRITDARSKGTTKLTRQPSEAADQVSLAVRPGSDPSAPEPSPQEARQRAQQE